MTQAPLDELRIGAQARKISAEQVATWEKSWGGQAGRLELNDGAAKVWTKGEREAGASVVRILKAAAPNPQTLYYRPGMKSYEPLLIEVQLQYRQPGRPATLRRSC